MLSQESIQSASVSIWLSGLAQLSIITGRCVTKTTGNFPGDFREKAPEVCTIMDHQVPFWQKDSSSRYFYLCGGRGVEKIVNDKNQFFLLDWPDWNGFVIDTLVSKPSFMSTVDEIIHNYIDIRNQPHDKTIQNNHIPKTENNLQKIKYHISNNLKTPTGVNSHQ